MSPKEVFTLFPFSSIESFPKFSFTAPAQGSGELEPHSSTEALSPSSTYTVLLTHGSQKGTEGSIFESFTLC